jgi:hypothetical protein
MPGCCPSPGCVHCWVSTPTRPAVQGPGVQPSGVQPVQCPAIWLSRPDAAVQPAGVQPVRCPAVWCLSVRPVTGVSSHVRRVVAIGRPRDGGAAVLTGSSRVSCGPAPVPGGSVDGPEEAWLWAPLRRSCAGRRGSVSRGPGPGGASAGGCTRPTDQAGQTAARGACRWRLRSGRRLVGAMLRMARVRRPSGPGPRLLCVVGGERDGRVEGPGRRIRARGRGRRAAPARPSQVASATGSTLAPP